MKVLLDYRERKRCPDFPQELPDSLFNEEWAEKIHGQSLSKLNSRGGLGPQEMIGNIKRLTFTEIVNYNFDQAIKELTEIYNGLR